jgi:hypothetical protein
MEFCAISRHGQRWSESGGIRLEQHPIASLPKVIVRCERFAQTVVVHHDKRRAVGEAPILVRASAIKFESLGNERLARWENLHKRTVLQCVDNLDRSPSLGRFRQGVCHFEKHEFSRDE